MSRTAQIALVAVLALAAFLIPYAVVSAQDEESGDAATVPSSDCPGANQVFEEEYLTPPDTYSPGCPDPDALRAELESGQEDTTQHEAVMEALLSGEIEQEQNPCTYPADLREIIELSNEQCDGELGRTLEAQYK